MSTNYKETSLGGLALDFHLPKCCIATHPAFNPNKATIR